MRRVPHAKPKSRTLAILCSGQGTNLQAILDAIRRKKLRATVSLVLSDREDAPALQKAERAGVQTLYINPKAYASREDFDQALISALKKSSAAWIVLAGFMRILSPQFVRAFRNRVLNIHPALLPAFRGADAVGDALTYGAQVTGVTVHFVDEKVDNGPVIVQEAVPIKSTDTRASLLKRIHQVEHRLYPQAIGWAVAGKLRIRGRRVLKTR